MFESACQKTILLGTTYGLCVYDFTDLKTVIKSLFRSCFSRLNAVLQTSITEHILKLFHDFCWTALDSLQILWNKVMTRVMGWGRARPPERSAHSILMLHSYFFIHCLSFLCKLLYICYNYF